MELFSSGELQVVIACWQFGWGRKISAICAGAHIVVKPGVGAGNATSACWLESCEEQQTLEHAHFAQRSTPQVAFATHGVIACGQTKATASNTANKLFT